MGPDRTSATQAGNRKRRLIRRLRLLRGRVVRCSTVMPDARPDIDIAIIETDIPARLDRLPWTRFHTLIVIALGITWVLDGLEVTIAGSIVGALRESPVLRFTEAEIGLVASSYLAGAVAGALLFGYLTDRFGRRKLFMVTLGLYLLATAATALRMGFLELRAVPGADRSRDRRRVRGDQLGDPGADPGALSRPHRPRGQRQLLGRRGARRDRRGRAVAAGAAAARLGVARGVRDRRDARSRNPGPAPVDSREPALADAARPPPRSRRGARRYRAPHRRGGRSRKAARGSPGSGSPPEGAPRSCA